MALARVISGGQTGADRAGLIAARQAGIPTGGWMPSGFLAHDGTHPEFAEKYGIRETTSNQYPPRTALNVQEADATLRFATDWNSPGETLTLKLCLEHQKPCYDVCLRGNRMPEEVAEWIVATGVRVLNVAGNSERRSPGIEEYVVGFLGDVFRLLVLSGSA
ncbi:MAG: putative molybdenum carrier protein [Planctomycetes bacterium]|nr:putative molybdenum carrier protein [Planctomycetota bacterium]